MKEPREKFREKPAEIEEAAHQRAEGVLEEKMEGRKMEDFIDGMFYTVDAVAGIADKVLEYEQIAKAKLAEAGEYVQVRVEKVRKITRCLEAIVLKTKTWFGPTSEVYPTTDWDRIQHGVDLVVERTKGEAVNHHGFALDVTFGKINHILEKINAIAELLKAGKLGRV
ncbi:hypothetical protein H7X65_02910, partial [Candidatus Parcubacteria bacterium]|nr:hypothetical protein [Candidatus Parcubacteria bacterium]